MQRLLEKPFDGVLLCTPVRDGRFHTGYVVGLMSCNSLHNGWMPMSGQTDIYVARNTILNSFYNDYPDHHTMVQIDSDIGFTHKDLKELILSPEPLVSGLYTDKSRDALPFLRDAKGEQVPPKDVPLEGMVKSGLLPGGFLKIERSVLKQIRDQKLTRTAGEGRIHLYYETRIHKDFQLSEDYAFSALCAQAGIQGWTNCGVRVDHDGRGLWNGQPVEE